MRSSRSFGFLALAAMAATSVAASAAIKTSKATEDIVVWVHGGATPAEKAAATTITDGFNASQSAVKATLKFVPDQQKVITATPADQLGDVIESDGEAMSANVYAKKLQPLNGLVSQAVLDNQTASVTAQNTFVGDGKRYEVSMFDSGIAFYGNKQLLNAAGVKFPTTWDKAWTVAQFNAALKALAGKDKDKKVLTVKENYGLAGYSTYAFLPIISSAGHLVLENGKARGALDNVAVVSAFKQVASWKKYSDPDADDKAFAKKRVALAWVGHWVYNDYKKALGKNLVVIPLPNFGVGAKSGQGSLAWGISAGTKKAKSAAAYLDYALSDASVKTMTDANAAPPGTKTVTAASKLYKPGGPLALYATSLAKSCGNNAPTKSCVAVPRTISAGWPSINANAGAAMNSIWTGANAQSALTKAAKAIDQDFTDNDGYKVK